MTRVVDGMVMVLATTAVNFKHVFLSTNVQSSRHGLDEAVPTGLVSQLHDRHMAESAVSLVRVGHVANGGMMLVRWGLAMVANSDHYPCPVSS